MKFRRSKRVISRFAPSKVSIEKALITFFILLSRDLLMLSDVFASFFLCSKETFFNSEFLFLFVFDCFSPVSFEFSFFFKIIFSILTKSFFALILMSLFLEVPKALKYFFFYF